MPENVMPGPVCDLGNVREAVCIHTRKIFDSCRDKDCVESGGKAWQFTGEVVLQRH